MVITLQTLFIPLVAQAEEDEKQERIPVEVLLALYSSHSGAVTILLHDTALPQPDGTRKHCGDRTPGYSTDRAPFCSS